MNFISLFLQWFAYVMKVVSALTVMVLALFVSLAVVMRYFLGSPFHFTEEVVGLLFMTVVFLVLPTISLNNLNIKVELLSDAVSGTKKKILRMYAFAVTLVFGLWFAWASLDLVIFTYEIGARTEQVGIPLVYWLAVIPLSMVAAVLGTIVQVYTDIFSKTEVS